MYQTAFPKTSDELKLARPDCCRLAKMMQGVLSVGMSAVTMENPAFLKDQQKKHAAFIEVLGAVGGNGVEAESMRTQAETLSVLSLTFFQRYIKLTQWRSQSTDETTKLVNQLMQSYESILDILEETGRSLGSHVDFKGLRKTGHEIAAGLPALLHDGA